MGRVGGASYVPRRKESTGKGKSSNEKQIEGVRQAGGKNDGKWEISLKL